MESADEERSARIIWAGHILSYLTNRQSNICLQGLKQVQATGERGDEEEELDDEQLDAATERMASLSESPESVRSRFLDEFFALPNCCHRQRAGSTSRRPHYGSAKNSSK